MTATTHRYQDLSRTALWAQFRREKLDYYAWNGGGEPESGNELSAVVRWLPAVARYDDVREVWRAARRFSSGQDVANFDLGMFGELPISTTESGPAEERCNSDNALVRQFLSGESQGPLGTE